MNFSQIIDWRAYNRQAARCMAFQGFPVFPCLHDKSPAEGTRWKEVKPRPHQDVTASWENEWGDYLPAIVLAEYRLLVIDPDVKNGCKGLDAWQALVAEYGLPDGVPIVDTPTGGRHYYFRIPNGLIFGNSPGSLPAGIDVRGAGGYVIAPGAMLPDGRRWSCQGDYVFRDAPLMPDWLIAILTPAVVNNPVVTARPKPVNLSGAASYWGGGFADEINALRLAKKGGRNTALNAAAFAIGQMVGKGGVDAQEAIMALVDAATGIGLVEDDGLRKVMATIRSGFVGSENKPRPEPNIKKAGPLLPPITGPVRRPALGAPVETEAEAPAATDAHCVTEAEVEAALASDFLRDDNREVAAYFPEIVQGLIMDGVTGMIGGQSGMGKSFVSMDLAVAIATGQPFMGREVFARGAVLVLAAEGGFDFGNRLMSAKKERGVSEGIHVWHTQFMGKNDGKLTDNDNLTERVAAIKAFDQYLQKNFGVKLKLTIIDTVNAAFPLGGRQEDNSYASDVTGRIDYMARETGVSTFAVHHFGKDQDSGLRGGSAYQANLDQVINLVGFDKNDKVEVHRGNFLAPAKTALILAKNRYGQQGTTFFYELKQVEIGVNPHGYPITSRVVVCKEHKQPNWANMVDRAKAPSPDEAMLMEAIKKCREFDHQLDSGSTIKGVWASEARMHFLGACPVPECSPNEARNIKTTRYNKGRRGLIARGFMGSEGEKTTEIFFYNAAENADVLE